MGCLGRNGWRSGNGQPSHHQSKHQNQPNLPNNSARPPNHQRTIDQPTTTSGINPTDPRLRRRPRPRPIRDHSHRKPRGCCEQAKRSPAGGYEPHSTPPAVATKNCVDNQWFSRYPSVIYSPPGGWIVLIHPRAGVFCYAHHRPDRRPKPLSPCQACMGTR